MKRLLLFCVAALLAACGGNGNGGSPLPAPAPSGGTQSAYVRFHITLPATTQSAIAGRRPNFETPQGTQSVSIALSAVNGTPHSGTAAVFNVSGSATGCGIASGTIACDATVTGTAGTDTFTVTAYPQSDGKGSAIARGIAEVTAVPGATVPAPITLSGTIASVSLRIAGVYTVGQTSMVPVTLIAKDATGATIMGTYDRPIELNDSDTSGVTKLSTISIGDSSTAAGVGLFYTGAPLASAITISANVSGLSAADITDATFAPNGDNPLIGGSTYDYNSSESWVYQYPGATPQPAITAGWSSVERIVPNAAFNGHSDLQDVHTDSTFSDATTGTTDSYVDWSVSDTSAKLLWYGQTSSGATSSESLKSTVPATWDIVPHAAGNTWASTDAYVSQFSSNQNVYNPGTRTSSPGTVVTTQTLNADGSYTSTYSGKTNDGSYSKSDSTTVNADGAASDYTVSSVDGATITVYGTPQPASGGNGMVIPVRTGNAPSPGPTPTVGPATLVPDWYPNGGAVPKPMLTDTYADKGSVTVPSSCNVPAGIPTSAEEIDETTWEFDPTGSLVTSLTKTYEAPNLGTVCVAGQAVYQIYDAASTGALIETVTYGTLETLTKATLSAALRRSGFRGAMTSAGTMLMARAHADRMRFLRRLRATRSQARSG